MESNDNDGRFEWVKKRLFVTYLFDWVSMIIIYGISGALDFITPFQRFYFRQDESISYPLHHETVPTWMLGLIAWGIPFICIAVLSLAYRRNKTDFHHACLGLFLSLALTLLVTQVVKISAGRLRPNFLARCKPSGDALTNNAPCTGDSSEVNEGRKSFPSGHSSGAFAGLGFLSFYLAGKLKLFASGGRFPSRAWKMIIVLLPLIGAYLIAISRVNDYYHHWQDVTAGGLLGLFFAYLVYRQYYHSIFGSESGKVYLPTKKTSAAEMQLSPTSFRSDQPPSASIDNI